ncbi:MAG: DUF3616 domain-containing protein [Pirellulales bacterium]
MCDASAAVAVGSEMFVVGNDEDNRLRVYRRDQTGKPVYSLDVSKFLQITKGDEADIEAAARVGNRIYWITSHGRNKAAKDRPKRHLVFAVDVRATSRGIELSCTGQPYKRLLRDMLADERLAKYNLAEAAKRAPKEPDALSIEGLAAKPDGTLLIGFRNPIPHGHALVLPLENPGRVVEGGLAKFGDPIELDLGGQGIRGMAYWQQRKEYLILAGHFGNSRQSTLLRWSGKGRPEPIRGVDFADWTPETIVTYADQPERVQVLSDDGTRKVNGMDCKLLPDENERRFRSGWLEVPLR